MASYRPLHARSGLDVSRDLAATARFGGVAALTALRRMMLAAVAGLLLFSVAPVAFGWTTTLVVSGSMAPAVHAGDIVAVSPVAPTEVGSLAPGTVVLVDDPAAPGRLLLHRLVGVTPDGKLITKGDANAVRDSTPVPPEHLRGRARLRIPALGLPVLWIQRGEYLPAVAVAVLSVIALAWRPGSDVAAGRGRRRRPSRPVTVLRRLSSSW